MWRGTVGTVGSGGILRRLRTPVDEIDRAQLSEWAKAQGGIPLRELPLRVPIAAVGEVRSVRIVPRAGADALEATISDGDGSLTAVFLGRRRIGGVAPGRRLEVRGVAMAAGNQRLMFNPIYRLF